jgi:3',5'-cyclic AMP phosphodiesterase CpdA
MKQEKSLIFSFLLVAAILAGETILPLSVSGQPDLIHLSLGTRKRFESLTPVIVTWNSEITAGKQYVRYGLTPETAMTVKAKRNDLDGKLVCNASLKKLKRGTRYYYRCGSDEAGWSRVYSFFSEPDTGSFRVGIIGDTQNNANNETFDRTRQIAGLVKIYSPFLTLHMGDIVDNGSYEKSWDDFLSATMDLNTGSPLMAVLGNHDVQNTKGKEFQEPFQYYHTLFNLPGDEVNYSFTYKNVRFIGIYSGCAEAAAETGQVKYSAGSPEYKWLENELSRAESDEDIEWIIVWMHYPVYSYGWSNIKDWRENILPLLENHRVDLCLAGHRHVYERHYQMKDGNTVKNGPGSVYRAGQGTLYITNGTAGGNPTGLGGKDLKSMAFTPDRAMYNFAIMDISDRSITYRVFDQENVLIDNFIIKR